MNRNDATSCAELGRRLGAWAVLGCLMVLGILVLGSGQGTLAAPGSWEPVTATMTAGRSYHAAAAGADGRIYAIGGVTNPPGLSGTVEVYDPGRSNEGWKVVAPMPTPRGSLAATTGLDGRIYAIGGANPEAPAALPTVEVYDPATNRWAPVAPLSVPRAGLAAVTGKDGRIYAIGGMGSLGRNAVEIYDPAKPNEGWKAGAPMPTPRRALAATTGSDRPIYAMGGDNGLTTVEAYTPGPPTTPGSWAPAASMRTARGGLGAAAGPDGRIYAIGGQTGGVSLDTVEAYTPGLVGTPGSWQPVASMGTARGALAATAETGPAGRIFAIGGSPGLKTAETYSAAGSTPPSSTTSTSSTTTTSTTTPAPHDSGPVREYPVAKNRRPYGITAGPDGNLWFTTPQSESIGRITPSGVITEHQLPGGNPCAPLGGGCSGLSDIVSGPDGNLWFTELANKIGQINPATGAIKEYLLPLKPFGSAPVGITAGPDGNLWFTESAANKIGRITPAGTITEFELPSSNSVPTDIVAGPDGNLWFTERSANKIGRITPGGTITEFEVPTAGSEPHDITTGPDGNLWFTEYQAGRVGRMNTAGVTVEYPVRSDGSEFTTQPLGITTGPDSAIWFTESEGDRIGRIDPGALPPPECPPPVSNTRIGPWATVTPMCTARSNLAATRAGNGRIFALGGSGRNFSSLALNTVDVYDAGMLVGRSANDRQLWADHRARLELGVVPTTTAPVVAQVSRSPRQAQLRRLLRGCDIVAFAPEQAHEGGSLLGGAGTADVVDAHLVVTAAGPAALRH